MVGNTPFLTERVKKYTYFNTFLQKNLEVKDIFCYFAPELEKIDSYFL